MSSQSTTVNPILARLELALTPLPCQKRRMFGCPVYFANDAMFAGIHGERIFIRLAAPDRARLLSEMPEAHPFAPLQGRVMREYAVLPDGITDEALESWLVRAHAYAATIPPRPPKKQRK